jgi:hypothetical protein
MQEVILINDVNRVYAGPGGRTVCGEGLFLVVEIAGSNSASGIDVRPMSQEEALRKAEY